MGVNIDKIAMGFSRNYHKYLLSSHDLSIIYVIIHFTFDHINVFLWKVLSEVDKIILELFELCPSK